MASDIRLGDEMVVVDGQLRVDVVAASERENTQFLHPILVDQIRSRAQESILIISKGVKLLRSDTFDATLGTALAHGQNDTLVLNQDGGYKGGVRIVGGTTIDGMTVKQIKADHVSAESLHAPVNGKEVDLLAFVAQLQQKIAALEKQVAALSDG